MDCDNLTYQQQKRIVMSQNCFRVYLTVYKPYVGTDKPSLYIGSTSKPEGSGYLGSVKSREWRSFWESEVKNHPENFDHFTLSTHKNMREALLEEYSTQKELDVVKSKLFFNKAVAAKNGMFGMDVSGQNNPMFGKSRKGQRVGGAVTPMFGRANPMYGRDWRDGKSAKEIEDHNKKCAQHGKKNGCYGKTFLWIHKGDEHKRHDKSKPIPNGWSAGFTKLEAMQEARKIKVICVETGDFYESIEAAVKATGFCKISSVCSGKRKKAGGFTWRYAA